MKTVYVLIGAGGTLLGVYLDKDRLIRGYASFGISCEGDNENELQLFAPHGQVIATLFEMEVID